MRLRLVTLIAAGAVVLVAATAAASAAPAKKALVTWKVGGETFRTYLTRPPDIRAVQRAIRRHSSAGIPIGRVARGTRENRGHRWHLERVRLVEVTIELCDGRPSDVDRDLTYWVETVKRFCPWSAVPVRLRRVSA